MYNLCCCLMLLARNEKESSNHTPGCEGSEGRKACPKMVSRDGLPRARCVEMEGPDPKKIVYEVHHRTV